MHTLVMDLEPGYIGTEPGFLYRFNRDLWQTITSSHLTLQTKQGRIKNFKLSGVIHQKATAGNQLFDAGTAKDGYYIKDDTGAESTTAAQKDKFASDYIPVLDIESITFNTKTAWGAWYDASKLYISGFGSSSAGRTLVIPENAAYMRFTGNIENKNVIMLNAGDTALPWEPYTGATSSPSPEYPQDVQGVGVRTAQMLDFTKDITYSGCTLMDADTGTIKCDIINDYYCRLKITYLNDYIMAHKGDNLIFYADQPLDTWITIIIWGTRSSGETYQEINGNGKVVKATIADDFTSIKILELRLNRKNATFTDTETVIPNLMLYEGATVKPYEPYGYRTDVVTRSKNLLDQQRMLDFILQKPGASIVQFDGRRCLKLDGGFNFPDFNLYEGFEPEKRYTLTYDGFYEKYKTEAYLGNGFAFTLQNGGRNLSLMDVSDIGTWKHKTTTSDTGVTKLTFTYGTQGVIYIDLDTIQLEEGSTPTPYQPYAYYTAPIYTQSPLTQWDRIEYRNGEYGVVKKSAVVVEDGSRNVDDTHYPLLFFSTLAKPMNVDAKVYCNYCSSERIGKLSIVGKNMCINSADTYWGFADAAECKAWLVQKNAEGQPLYYCYETTEETWEPLPAISQQALKSLPTYKGTTIIDTTDPLEPEITVSYRPQKKNFFNPDKVFSSLIPGVFRYYKYDLRLSPGNYVWSMQKNEFLGSRQHVLFTNDLEYEGSGIVSGKIYDWIGHSTSEPYCRTYGSFVVRDEMYIAVLGGNVNAVKPLLKTLIIEKA